MPRIQVLALLLSALLLSGCGASRPVEEPAPAYVDAVSLEEETVPLAQTPGASAGMTNTAPGLLTKQNARATVDYSNTGDGYVMVRCTGANNKKLKAQVKGPTTTYTYHLTSDEWTAFPLSDGNGAYQVTLYENISGAKYAALLSASFSVELTDEFAPFLRPNQYVDYAKAEKTIAKARELTQGKEKMLEQVAAVYDFVINNVTYDKNLAATVQSGYLPVLDTVLTKKTGICFDYAALMTGMLRSQGVPCKLVVGYAGTAYHAWINVWSEETGWVNSAIYFDGDTWQRMDPTFASSGKESASIMQYIGDGAHYTVKYLY